MALSFLQGRLLESGTESPPYARHCLAPSDSEFFSPSPLERPSFSDIPDGPFILFDGLGNPGNIGSILRTAYGFGVESIFIHEKCFGSLNSRCNPFALPFCEASRLPLVTDFSKSFMQWRMFQTCSHY